jgi:hypothetical protein
MRVVEYSGVAVKKQRKINGSDLLLTFYDQTQKIVSIKEWEQNASNKYYDSSVRRRDVVRAKMAIH